MAKAKGSTKTGGRQKGTPNKFTGDAKAAIAAAFDEVGGKDYLVALAKSDPRTFCSLVAKIVPAAQHVDMNLTNEFSRMSDEELEAFIKDEGAELRRANGHS